MPMEAKIPFKILNSLLSKMLDNNIKILEKRNEEEVNELKNLKNTSQNLIKILTTKMEIKKNKKKNIERSKSRESKLWNKAVNLIQKSVLSVNSYKSKSSIRTVKRKSISTIRSNSKFTKTVNDFFNKNTNVKSHKLKENKSHIFKSKINKIPTPERIRNHSLDRLRKNMLSSPDKKSVSNEKSNKKNVKSLSKATKRNEKSLNKVKKTAKSLDKSITKNIYDKSNNSSLMDNSLSCLDLTRGETNIKKQKISNLKYQDNIKLNISSNQKGEYICSFPSNQKTQNTCLDINNNDSAKCFPEEVKIKASIHEFDIDFGNENLYKNDQLLTQQNEYELSESQLSIKTGNTINISDKLSENTIKFSNFKIPEEEKENLNFLIKPFNINNTNNVVVDNNNIPFNNNNNQKFLLKNEFKYASPEKKNNTSYYEYDESNRNNYIYNTKKNTYNNENNLYNDTFYKNTNNISTKRKEYIESSNKENININCTNSEHRDNIKVKESKNIIDNYNDINYSNNANFNSNLKSKGYTSNNTVKKDKGVYYMKEKNIVLNSKLNYILPYLSIKDIINLFPLSKHTCKSVLDIIIPDMVISNEENKNNLLKFKSEHINEKIESFKLDKFVLNNTSQRALCLLNSVSAEFYEEENKNVLLNKDILKIYEIYFATLGKSDMLNKYNSNDEKWNFICKHFCCGKTLSEIIEGDLNNRIFDDKTINILYKLSSGILNKISPSYFQKINKNISIFVFVIKDILDHIGIVKDIYNGDSKKTYALLKSNLNIENIVLDKLSSYYKYTHG